MAKLRVLFLCTHNSARSQMAERLLRYLVGDRFEVMSAGIEATLVGPLTVWAIPDVAQKYKIPRAALSPLGDCQRL